MKKILSVLLCLLVLISICSIPVSAAADMDYILDKNGKTHIPTPVTYNVKNFIQDLGEEFGELSEPSDMYVGSDDSIYIADTGNNRIVKLSPEGKVVSTFTNGGQFKEPKGVYVDTDGDVYVSDTMNEKIVHLDKDGNFVEEFTKPDSDLLDKDMSFQVGRVGISKQGYLYTIRGQYFMEIDAENEFKGFVGLNKVGFSLKSFLIRMFASEKQKAQLLNEEPDSYNSFDIGDDGLIYATLGGDVTTGQIQIINMVEQNIYPVLSYGEVLLNEHTGNLNNPQFVDITVGDGTFIYVLEQYSKCVYVYDRDGTLVSVFGGEGTVKGRFSVPTAIEINSKGEILVLDKQTGAIHHFAPTVFINDVLSARRYYDNGEYNKSAEMWKRVLETDANYVVANRGLANCCEKFENYKEAMEYYRIADDTAGYGKAFSEYRHGIFREHFFLVVVIIAVIATLLLLFCVFLKKTADKRLKLYLDARGISNRMPMSILTHLMLTLVHPLDNIDILKAQIKKKTAWLAIPGLLLLTVLVNYTYIFFAHYSLSSKQPADANILLEFALVLVPFFSFTVASYFMSSIMSGESKFTEQMLAYSYTLVPYILIKPLIGLLSNVLCFNEKGLYDLLLTVALGWTLILIFTTLKRLNDYTLGRAVAVTFLAILMVAIMWAVILLIASLTIQTTSFFSGIFEEFVMKYLS